MPNYMDLILDGTSQIADDAAFDPTADCEWRFDVALPDYTPALDQALASRWVGFENNRQWIIYVNDTNGNLQIDLGSGTGTVRGTISRAVTWPADGERVQIRGQIDADNGASATAWSVYTRSGANIGDLETDTDWTLQGTATLAGVQSWKAIAHAMQVGRSQDTGKSFAGKYYRFIMWTDLTKTAKVADIDFTDEANIDAAAVNDNRWDDGVSANDWVMQGTHETNWDYIREGGFPDAPLNLTATPVSETQVDLSWDAVTGANFYDIERDSVIIQRTASTLFSDTGRTANTQYSYRVRAVK